MAAEFEKADIDVSFFNAVVVPNTNNDAIAKAEGVKLGRYARRLTRGELGCYFSHRRLWEQLLQSDEMRMSSLKMIWFWMKDLSKSFIA